MSEDRRYHPHLLPQSRWPISLRRRAAAMRRAKLLAGAFAALLVAAGCDQLAQPENFDDCILKHVSGVGSDRAAVMISQSCREKFPDTRTGDDTEPTDSELTDAELSELTGRFRVSGRQYGGTIYNGNPDITVTSMTFTVTATLDDNAESREYRTEATIPPLTVGDFGVHIIPGDEGTEYSWDITSARGNRKQTSP